MAMPEGYCPWGMHRFNELRRELETGSPDKTRAGLMIVRCVPRSIGFSMPLNCRRNLI